MRRYIPREPTVDFNWNAVEPLDPDVHAEAVARAAQALKLTLEWLWMAQSFGRPAIVRRLAAILLVLRSSAVSYRTYTEAAKALGCTRAAVSKDAVRFCDQFHAHLGQKTETHRQHLRQARLSQVGPDGKVVSRMHGAQRSPAGTAAMKRASNVPTQPIK